ncbi:carbon-nitrogen hydrolase family protein [Longitalea arenae]|uniref:carbon-nitrogen hydrolase family protein n=1 Tax=Longitalea arenae TaxID=2812558 RepID=UPI001967DAFC|nr:carbon-nitrogen hydrolase family protein [Longitalea arenae]
MKIALAQTRPARGDMPYNITRHTQFIEQAAANGAGLIVFPELSLTGYEPSLCKQLATDATDSRLAIFQQLSNEKQLIIGAGLPTKGEQGIHISMVLFQPGHPPQVNSKMYLHADEDPFFIPGINLPGLIINNTHIALAICYEISVPEHAEKAGNTGADLYLASVAKTAKGVEKAAARLSEVAHTYGMTVLMVNSVGICEDGECAGNSAVWDEKGSQIARLENDSEGILLYDTVTQAATTVTVMNQQS